MKTQLLRCLQQRVEDIRLPRAISEAWLTDFFLKHPALTATLNGLGVFYGAGLLPARLRVLYQELPADIPVFLVRDRVELLMSAALSLRMHVPELRIVVDNRSGALPMDELRDLFYQSMDDVGEELAAHQYEKSTWCVVQVIPQKVMVIRSQMWYFNTAEETNALSCILAEQAAAIRTTCTTPLQMLYQVRTWFQQNIRYRNTGSIQDHSAVGTLRNKTAVCQGIAAYALVLLTYCGIPTRYVEGDGDGRGGWARHAWNMVYLGDRWYPIDFTFDLHYHGKLPRSERAFRKDHRWDSQIYSARQSAQVLHRRDTMNHSVVITEPNSVCWSINGMIVDASASHRLCLVHDGEIWLSLTDLMVVYGGCCRMVKEQLRIDLGTSCYRVPRQALLYRQGGWYLPAAQMTGLGFTLEIQGRKLVLSR